MKTMKTAMLPALALAFTLTGARGALLAYDDFATSGELDGTTGGPNSFGFDGKWESDAEQTQENLWRPDDVEAAHPASGGRVVTKGTTKGTRELKTTIDTSKDGIYYASFALGMGGSSEAGFLQRSDTTKFTMGVDEADHPYLRAFGEDYTDTSITLKGSDPEDGVGSVFMVIKMVTSANGKDEVFGKVYDQVTNAGPEPSSWDIHFERSNEKDEVYDEAYFLLVGGDGKFSGVDEWRFGETWADVAAVPEPSLGLFSFLLLGAGAMLRRRG